MSLGHRFPRQEGTWQFTGTYHLLSCISLPVRWSFRTGLLNFSICDHFLLKKSLHSPVYKIIQIIKLWQIIKKFNFKQLFDRHIILLLKINEMNVLVYFHINKDVPKNVNHLRHFKVAWYFDFIIMSGNNATLHEYVCSTKWQKYV